MGERAVRTRRKPGGGKRREPLGARRRTCPIAFITPRVMKHGLSGSPAVRHFLWSELGPRLWFSRITKHESRPFYRVLRPSGGEKCRLAALSGSDLGSIDPHFPPPHPQASQHRRLLRHRDTAGSPHATFERRPCRLPRFRAHQTRITAFPPS